jgi:hypothetical protein
MVQWTWASPEAIRWRLPRAPAFAKRYGAASRHRKAAICQATFHANRIGLHWHFVEVGGVCFARAALRRAARAKEKIFLGTCTQGVVPRLTVPWAIIGPHLRRSHKNFNEAFPRA